MRIPRPVFCSRVGRWARMLWQRVHRSRPTGRQLAAMGVLVALGVGTVAGLVQLRTDTGPSSFLPAEDPALDKLEEAAGSFGGDPIVVLAESRSPHELLSQRQLPRLLALEGKLANLDDVAVVYGPATGLNQIAAAMQNMMASLSGQRDALRARAMKDARDSGATEKQAKAAAAEAVAGFDKRYGALFIRGLPAGLPTLHNPAFVNHVIFDDAGVPKAQWDFLVPRGNAVSILVRPREGLDQAGIERLVERVRRTVADAKLATERVTVSGVPAVTAGLGEQVSKEVPLLGGLAIVGIGASYLLVPWIRRRWYRLLPMVATLGATMGVLAGFGWLNRPLSLGVIAFLPILMGIGSDFPAYLAHAGERRRVVVVALASASAFASLAVSPLPFVRDLGLALAVGQVLALGLGLVMARSWRRAGAEETEATTTSTQGRSKTPSTWISVDEAKRPRLRTRIGALALLGLVALAGWGALRDLAVEAEPDKLAEGLPAIEDVHRAERILGASGQVQVLVRGDDVLTPTTLAWMHQVQNEIVVNHGDELKPVLTPPSLLAFLGPEPTSGQIAAGMRLMPEYLTQAVIRGDQRRAAMTFQLELQDLAAQKRLLEGVRTQLADPPEGVSADVVGLPVAAARGYELISGDRYLTNGIGIFGAGMILLLGLRRWGDAGRAVLAAVLATGWGLAGLWALDVALTPLTIALGSLTTAVACEYTVMLRDAAGWSSRGLARTVTAATLAATLGYLALTASGVSVLREFGLVLAGTVLLSFAASHAVVRLLPSKRNRASGSAKLAPVTGYKKEVMA